LFPGFVIIVLAAAGIVLAWRSDAHPIVVAMLTVGAFGFVLSLGPDGMRPLYAFFHRFIFGFQAIRAPARFAVLAMFAMTTLAALGWRELSREAHKARRMSANHYWGVAIIALMALEFVDVPIPMSPAPARQTDIGRWLERASGPGPVIYLPLGLDVESTPAMVQSLEHRRPIVNGYSGQRPAFYAALVDTLSGFPSDDALLALKEIGVRFAVTKKPLMPPSADAAWPLVERARFADGLIYEFHWTPELDERLRAAATVTPPVPGIVPFRPGERATYAVRWAGAVDLPAGQITVRVERPDYTFLVGAESAPWVARFFEAKDAFTTRAGPDLLPELHERDQKEGARHETRVFVYDHARGLVHLGRTVEQALGSEGVNLPLPAGSRDAISALFYVRTLPLEPGARYAIPVNEAGRNLVVDVVVTGRESVQIQGKSQEAIRIEPRVRRPAERRRPGIATIWLSADARRVPLAFDVEASFGKVRIELVSYDQR
jgi:hypothetical protein